MARSIWSGSISFGLVNIPVKLFPAISPKEVRFHMVHDADRARIKQKRICSADGNEVPYEHIAKGYEVSSGRYVVISREELEAFDPKATRTIDIEEFVELAQIDPIYYQTTYYLVPDRGAAKAYALLATAMADAKKVGIAKMVLRTKQYLCAIRPIKGVLSVSTMLYADEVIPQSELGGLPSADAKPKQRELAMAEQLVQSLAAKFDPGKYKDDYREKVLQLIKAKSEGRKIVAPAQERDPAKVVNLMEALKASLAADRRQLRGETRTEPSAEGERRHRREAAKQTGRKRKKSA